MANLPSERLIVQTEQTTTRSPVSEGLEQTLGASLNQLQNSVYVDLTFTLNGALKTFNGLTGVDGIKTVRNGILTWALFDVVMYAEVMGSGGTTELDVERSAFSGGSFGAWTSIFSVTPKITSSAVAYSTVSIGTSVSGCTAPVLTTTPLILSPLDRFRLKVVSVQAGNSKFCGLTLQLRGDNP